MAHLEGEGATGRQGAVGFAMGRPLGIQLPEHFVQPVRQGRRIHGAQGGQAHLALFWMKQDGLHSMLVGEKLCQTVHPGDGRERGGGGVGHGRVKMHGLQRIGNLKAPAELLTRLPLDLRHS